MELPMKITPNSFFNTVEKFKVLNLNILYLCRKHEIPDPKKPEQIQNQLVKYNFDHLTFGGYAEDRRDVWATTYMKETGKFIHLGVDINMEYGTEVVAPFKANVVDKFEDVDTKIGWGGRLILEHGGKYLVLAHLAPESLTDRKVVKAGERLGSIGTWPTNGNTFHHLHVQVITHQNFKDFDGYGFRSELTYNPDPFKVDFK